MVFEEIFKRELGTTVLGFTIVKPFIPATWLQMEGRFGFAKLAIVFTITTHFQLGQFHYRNEKKS